MIRFSGFLFLLLLSGCGTAAVSGSHDQVSDAGQVVDQVYAAYNSRNLEQFLALFAPDVVIYRPPETLWLSGADAVRRWYTPRFAESPRARGSSRNRIVHGRYVIDQDHVTGLSTGPDRTVVWVYEIERGKFVRAWVLP
jgi:hypothetical protein